MALAVAGALDLNHDGAPLARLMIRHGVGCRVEEVLHIKKFDEQFVEP
jgi:restriction system protein